VGVGVQGLVLMQMLEEKGSEGSKQSQVSDSRCGCCVACHMSCDILLHCVAQGVIAASPAWRLVIGFVALHLAVG
jgi:hypothetical protein